MPDIPYKYNCLATVVLVALPLLLFGQSVEYKISGQNQTLTQLPELPSTFSGDLDSLQDKITQSFVEFGYLDTKVDVWDSVSYLMVEVIPGMRYSWGELVWEDVPDFVNRELTQQNIISRGKPFTKTGIDSLTRRITQVSEEEGFPFAEVGLDNMDLVNNDISASLIYSTGEAIVYGPMVVEGEMLKPSFLQNYLMIRQGAPYDQKELRQIPQRFGTFPFAELTKPPVVTFSSGKAIVSVQPKRTPANIIDAIIGVLPNERGEGLRITGQVDLELANLFRSAKSFELHWRSFQEKTQDLNLRYLHPALFGSALDASLQFELLRQDTSFLNRRLLIAFQTRSFQKQSFGFFLDLNGSSSIADDRTIQSFSMNYVGGRYRYTTLDRPRFPRKGMLIEASGSVGLKALQTQGGLADSLRNSTQGRGHFKMRYYHKTTGAIQIFGRIQGGILLNDQLYINDAFRLGGLQSLRGFNENEFFATRFTSLTAELRILLSNDSYMYGFFDQGFLALDVVEMESSDIPFGFGVGALLNTGSGLLNLAFALGRSNAQPLAIDFSKIHFGYVVVF